MEFGRSFSYVFEDSDWFKKIAIMALVALIPVLGQFVLMGWGAEIVRRVVRGADVPIPELDFGAQLSDGFKLFVVSLVYSLPIIVIALVMGIVMGVSAQTITMISSICFGLINVVLGILIAFLVPAAFANFAVKGNISDGLRIGEVFGLVKNNLSAYLLVFVGIIIASFVASLGSIACGIGVLLTAVYANAIMMHLYGQAYKKATAA
jgi:hypothetical protein